MKDCENGAPPHLVTGTRPTRWIVRLAALPGSPQRTAAAFAVGVFLSFSPLLGLQIATGLLLSVALRLNRIALVAGLCTNLPWLMVPWYAISTAVAAAAFRIPLAADLRARLSDLLQTPIYRAGFWERAGDLVSPVFWPFVMGSTVGALVLGAVAYVLMSRVMIRAQAAVNGS